MRKSAIFTAVALAVLILGSYTPGWAQFSSSTKTSIRPANFNLISARDTNAIRIGNSYEKVVLEKISSWAKSTTFSLKVRSGFYTKKNLLNLVKAQVNGTDIPTENAVYSCTAKGNKKYATVYVLSYTLPKLDANNAGLIRPMVVLRARTSQPLVRGCNPNTKAAPLPQHIQAKHFSVDYTAGISDDVQWTSVDGLSVTFDPDCVGTSECPFEPGPAKVSQVTFLVKANKDDTKAMFDLFDDISKGNPMDGSINVHLLHPENYATLTTFKLSDLALVKFSPIGVVSDSEMLSTTFTVAPGSVEID